MKTTTHTLAFHSVAKNQHPYDSNGVIYVHHFGTGWQHLFFASHAEAERWALAGRCDFIPHKKHARATGNS